MGDVTKTGEIEGVVVQKLQQLPDDRGSVLHMLRNDSPLFMGFGEVYFSEVVPGTVKAWKRHKKMTQHLAVPVGKIRLVLFDERPGSRTKGNLAEYAVGRPSDYNLIRIPPMVWYGFQSLAGEIALIVNCTDIPHDPEEIERLESEAEQIPYKW